MTAPATVRRCVAVVPGHVPGRHADNGYLPDTSSTAFDKRNVRDGHYLGWSHVVYLTASTPTRSRPTCAPPRGRHLTGSPTATLPAGLDPLALVAGKGLVPICAMNVERDAEGGR